MEAYAPVLNLMIAVRIVIAAARLLHCPGARLLRQPGHLAHAVRSVQEGRHAP